DELHEELINVDAVVQSVISLVHRSAEKGSVDLRVDLQKDLPALSADRRKVLQIFVNLVANAVKFTKPGGKITLKAWCSKESGLVFQVVDTGIGMAPEEIPKAFSKFVQVDNDLNRRYEGTGLGLPLTKGLVELHGGSLDLQSEVGVGTTATVRFPAHRIVTSKRRTAFSKLAEQHAP
ncbi:MAG: sensor histidine kinase, partial [Alphaproteobacteria bacterium]|nr:sensor histidine kinase [Alphaproteobacteria bacterium]